MYGFPSTTSRETLSLTFIYQPSFVEILRLDIVLKGISVNICIRTTYPTQHRTRWLRRWFISWYVFDLPDFLQDSQDIPWIEKCPWIQPAIFFSSSNRCTELHMAYDVSAAGNLRHGRIQLDVPTNATQSSLPSYPLAAPSVPAFILAHHTV